MEGSLTRFSKLCDPIQVRHTYILIPPSFCLYPSSPWVTLRSMGNPQKWGNEGRFYNIQQRWLSMESVSFLLFFLEGCSELLGLHLSSCFGFISWWYVWISIVIEPFDLVEETLYKGLEDLWILVSVGVLEQTPCGFQGMTIRYGEDICKCKDLKIL